jgi:hypothetical protein
MALPANPFADPVKIANVNIKLQPAETQQVKSFLESTGLTKANGWSVLLHTALAALNGDTATVEKAHAYVTALKAELKKK